MSFQPPSPLLPETPGLSPGEIFNLAGFGQRFVARVIDGILTSSPLLIFYLLPSQIGPWSLLVWWSAFLGLTALNDVALTTVRGGTVGKLLVGTRVVTLKDQQPVSAGIAGRRWASMVVMSFIPFLGFIDDLWIFTGQMRQTLHDKFAETIVVRAGSV
jgi:uncharacterized RDD family membrane protein YckC